jgi:flagellar assembly protein FliH
MNSFKSKIIKSEAVKIVTGRSEDSMSGENRPPSSMPRNNGDRSRQQIQQVVLEAYEKGLAEGLRKGRDLRDRESSNTLKAAEEAVRQAGTLKASIIERSEEDILHLVLDIAEKVLHHEVTSNQDVVKNILRSAIQSITDRENIRVHCHPEDLSVLKEIRPEMMQTINGVSKLEFIEDAAVGRGGVRLESGFGEVDARVDKQFDVIKKALLS